MGRPALVAGRACSGACGYAVSRVCSVAGFTCGDGSPVPGREPHRPTRRRNVAACLADAVCSDLHGCAHEDTYFGSDSTAFGDGNGSGCHGDAGYGRCHRVPRSRRNADS